MWNADTVAKGKHLIPLFSFFQGEKKDEKENKEKKDKKKPPTSIVSIQKKEETFVWID